MGIYQWAFTVVTVALLLDPTFGDVLVQPGYTQTAKKNTQSPKSQPVGNPQQNNPPQYHPMLQMLQQEHAIQQQQLKNQHAQEQNYLLGLQQQQLQEASIYSQQQATGGEVVGTPWGGPTVGTYLPLPYGGGAAGGYHGGRLFSLGPLGLNSLRLGTFGGLGGLGRFPVLMSPHQPNEMIGSAQSQTPVAGPTQPRTKRDIRDRREISSHTSRQRGRTESHGVAANPTLKSKSDTNFQNTQPSNTKQDVVGNSQKQENENVGSSLLDPLGLVDKTEGLIQDLKSGKLPNPLEMLNNGRYPGHVRKENLGESQFEEHVVGRSQQHPALAKSNNGYMMMNRPQYQYPQSRAGSPYPMYTSPSPRMGPSLSPYPYGVHPSSYQPYGPRMRQSNSMAYQGSPMIGASNPAQQINPQKYWDDPMTGAQNPAVQNPSSKFTMSGQNPSMTEGQDSTLGNAQVATEKTSDSRQSSSVDQMTADPIIGAPNPSLGSPAGYDQMVGSPMQMNNLYHLARAVQPMLGTLINPLTGNSAPAAWSGGGGAPLNYQNYGAPGGLMGARNSMAVNRQANGFYDPNRQMSYYDPQNYRHFDFDDVFDDLGYNQHYNHNHNHNHHGSIDRIYETYVDDPYSYGGRPHHMHNHQGYIF